MRRILLTMAGILVSTGAQAEISTAVVPLVATANPASGVACYVANTSVYPRSGKVTLYSEAGAILAEMPYALDKRETEALSFQPTPMAIGAGVRCAVTGNGNAGEAGLRASLCVVALGGFPPPGNFENVCVQAN